MPRRNDTALLKQHFVDLQAAIVARNETEAAITQKSHNRGSMSTSSLQRIRREAEQRHAARLDETQDRHNTQQQELADQFHRHSQATHRKWQSTLRDLETRFDRDSEAIERERADARWMVTSVLDEEHEQEHERQLKAFNTEFESTREQLETELAETEQSLAITTAAMQRCRLWRPIAASESTGSTNNPEESLRLFREAYRKNNDQTAALRNLWLPRMFAGYMPVLLILLIWLPIFAAAFVFGGSVAPRLGFDPRSMGWGAATGITTLFAGLLIVLILREITRTSAVPLIEGIQESAQTMQELLDRWVAGSERERQSRERAHAQRAQSHRKERKAALKKIDGIADRKLQQLTEEHQSNVAAVNQEYQSLIDDLTSSHEREMNALDEQLQTTVTGLTDRFRSTIDTVTRQQDAQRNQNAVEENSRRMAMAQQWSTAITRFATFADEFNARVHSTTPAWASFAGEDWDLPEEMPTAVRFGAFDCDLQKLPNGLSKSRRLLPERTQFSLPAVLSFPEHASLLLKTRGEGRTAATHVLRNVMLRLLTSLPRGKVRFTVIDPVGMGEPFSAFMHLADYDELMIGSRIWTDAAQIEKQLAALSEHMENIFQSYLRNDFETIDEYNRHAGEVAEPYHVLVVANFPVNISETAARRLANIVASGARCGVLTLISVDESQPLPHQFNLTDLESNAFTAEWKDDRFVSTEPELATLPLTLDEPPSTRDFTRIVKTAGRLSKDARRVEVAFDRIAPRPEEMWSRCSKTEIDIPLGRAGATKLQSLRLGQGTSQHVLIVGKTGSGKSSFLHALITNLALHYSPDEIEFYLIDFKKGVEFKTYATHSLPHARVIGIESDREFGVSVLERLDEIMQERGDLFRACGVQDVNAFREARPQERMPRIMLMVDEFQEFFVEDDSLSHSATQLLDRLVRQGRAFGIHVLLGSQTLGGAYSLPRSTIGQFAVRIALQCSENDAHLILSEDNTAARLLTRPGEAIYNDANGLLEGNHPFQIAWLADSQRESKLQQIREKTGRGYEQLQPPVVFEGNIASNLADNQHLVAKIAVFAEGISPETPTAIQTWLGESVSIKPAAQITFARRPGDNLLIVGPDSDSAHGIMTATVIAAAAQLAVTPSGESDCPTFVLLAEESADHAETWHHLSEVVPHAVQQAGCEAAAAVIRELHDTVQGRIQNRETDHAPIFLLISDLGRFRDLKNERDEFDFSGMGDPKPAGGGELLAEILRDGPAVGVHAVLWCDTYANLNRWCNQSTLREFEQRIVFRMNSADSSHLIDSSDAARLGPYRALLYRGETGSLEKFRPYGVPNAKWLNRAGDQFQGRETEIEEWKNLDALTVV